MQNTRTMVPSGYFSMRRSPSRSSSLGGAILGIGNEANNIIILVVRPNTGDEHTLLNLQRSNWWLPDGASLEPEPISSWGFPDRPTGCGNTSPKTVRRAVQPSWWASTWHRAGLITLQCTETFASLTTRRPRGGNRPCFAHSKAFHSSWHSIDTEGSDSSFRITRSLRWARRDGTEEIRSSNIGAFIE